MLPYSRTEWLGFSGAIANRARVGEPVLPGDIGGFAEVTDTAGARLVAPDGADALREALSGLIEEAGERERVVAISTAAAAGPYSWDEAARRTLLRGMRRYAPNSDLRRLMDVAVDGAGSGVVV